MLRSLTASITTSFQIFTRIVSIFEIQSFVHWNKVQILIVLLLIVSTRLWTRSFKLSELMLIKILSDFRKLLLVVEGYRLNVFLTNLFILLFDSGVFQNLDFRFLWFTLFLLILSWLFLFKFYFFILLWTFLRAITIKIHFLLLYCFWLFWSFISDPFFIWFVILFLWINWKSRLIINILKNSFLNLKILFV